MTTLFDSYQNIQSCANNHIRMARINTKIVTQFIDLQKSLPQIVEAYAINIKHMCETTQINRITYYRKLKDQSFTASELKKICDYINK